jgi:hypothetical protein
MAVIGAFAERHMQRYGHKKTVILLFRPNPHAASYPTEQQLRVPLSALTGSTSFIRYRDEDGQFIQQSKYLGMLLHVSMSWGPHLEQITIPKIMTRLAALKSAVTSNGLLSPPSCMMLLEIDVLSCLRYGAELWGYLLFSVTPATTPQRWTRSTLSSLCSCVSAPRFRVNVPWTLPSSRSSGGLAY